MASPKKDRPDGRPRDVTQMLVDWSNGHPEALDQLMPLVYDELRRLARHHLRREHSAPTLQPTALVHEAYLRLVSQKDVHWQNRAQFFGVAARLIRQILVDHARAHHRRKRGGDGRKVSLDEAAGLAKERDVALLALDDALSSLAEIDPQQSRIVELRFFGGLTEEEIAEVLGLSLRTVEREWRIARAWLQREFDK